MLTGLLHTLCPTGGGCQCKCHEALVWSWDWQRQNTERSLEPIGKECFPWKYPCSTSMWTLSQVFLVSSQTEANTGAQLTEYSTTCVLAFFFFPFPILFCFAFQYQSNSKPLDKASLKTLEEPFPDVLFVVSSKYYSCRAKIHMSPVPGGITASPSEVYTCRRSLETSQHHPQKYNLRSQAACNSTLTLLPRQTI